MTLNNQICSKCFYFKPAEKMNDYFAILIRASCQHPHCFIREKKQNDYGEIYYKDKRINDIINFVDDKNCCDRFKPFKLVKKKSFLWFKKYEKVMIEKEE